MRSIAFTALLGLAIALPAAAVPVTVTQTLDFQSVQPFGTFSGGTYTAPAWAPAFPFTNASQITGIKFTFSTDDEDFTNPALFPTNDGGGIPGLEIGVMREDGPGRLALASINAAAPDLALNLGLPDSQSVRGWLLDGSLSVSIGAFTNFASAGYSTDLTLNAPSRLLLTITGDVPQRVPEPGPLALLAAAVLAGFGVSKRSARR